MDERIGFDLAGLAHHFPGLWEPYRHARMLVTGGTGFVGKWLLESFLRATDERGLDASVTVVTRSPEAFLRSSPALARHPGVELLQGDVLTLQPLGRSFTHVIHGATSSSAKEHHESPRLMFDTIVEGTRRVIEVARRAGASRFLFVSSGAVYGRQPPELSHVGEEHAGIPDPGARGSHYGEGKREAERLCALAGREAGMETVVARCFAFSGPYLPLDTHFAIGNFVRDAIAGGPILVAGDGSPIRSYLYGADLAAWLWTILARGRGGRAYNVGSESAVSIAELAATVARVLRVPGGVEIAGRSAPGRLPERYVPSTRRAHEELGLTETFDLETGILRMAEFAGARGPPR
jgi:nucleoside-diphosphate-sugar epimerase